MRQRGGHRGKAGWVASGRAYARPLWGAVTSSLPSPAAPAQPLPRSPPRQPAHLRSTPRCRTPPPASCPTARPPACCWRPARSLPRGGGGEKGERKGKGGIRGKREMQRWRNVQPAHGAGGKRLRREEQEHACSVAVEPRRPFLAGDQPVPAVGAPRRAAQQQLAAPRPAVVAWSGPQRQRPPSRCVHPQYLNHPHPHPHPPSSRSVNDTAVPLSLPTPGITPAGDAVWRGQCKGPR